MKSSWVRILQGGRIFDFPIDFSMGLTTVQRYCAACDPREKSRDFVNINIQLSRNIYYKLILSR